MFSIQPTEFCEYAVDGLITCKGKIGFYAYQMPIQLSGHFQGTLFLVDSDCIPDEDRLIRYLAPWISDAVLKKLDSPVFELDEEMLLRAGLSKEKASDFIKKRNQIAGKEKLARLLLEYSTDRDTIETVLHRDVTYSSMLSNPYHSCIYNGLNVYYADSMAARFLHIHPYAPIRLIGFIQDAMKMSRDNGNTCIHIQTLMQATNHRLSQSVYPDTRLTIAMIHLLIKEMKIVEHIRNGEVYLYEKQIYDEEQTVLRQIERLNTSRQPLPESDIPAIESALGIRFTDGQKNAFHALSSTGIKILTGAPGTGKTSVIKGFIHGRKSVRLSATTGRASQVLKGACGIEAVTVHKLLDIRPYGEDISLKNANNPIQTDLIVVDEISMAGLHLFSLLLQAVTNHTILLLVGDEDQLQSVEYGNVLSDLIHSGRVETYHLTEVMRQDGSIRENAVRIKNGQMNVIEDDSFELIECRTQEEALQALWKRITDRSQILTTIKKSCLGTRQLNHLLQDKRGEYCLSYGKNNFYKGNRIIMLQTNYDKGYYNGDMGVVIGRNGRGLDVKLNGEVVSLDRDELAQVDLAYAVTIHKSQGSEFDTVHVVLPDESPNMLTRRLIYTAVTRGKKHVYVYSVKNTFQMAVRNTNERTRTTLLRNMLEKIEK